MIYLIYYIILNFSPSNASDCDWGFFAHKTINRMAVFTLPQDLLPFYKKHIEYISQHAVDPDKRRYMLPNEFSRHYIDIDHWDTIPFDNMPRYYPEALLQYGELQCVNGSDTSLIHLDKELQDSFYKHLIHPVRYTSSFSIKKDSISSSILEKEQSVCSELVFQNRLVQYGVLPYFLEDFYMQLVYAFEEKNIARILKISADIGHYISDGHVPLHTTINYNGQLTDQIGIHAFWESRLPELYALSSYDFIVGSAEYIPDVTDFVWDMVTESHALLDVVLLTEKELSLSFPEDQQYCFDERSGRTIWTQCPEYCEAYHNQMCGIVEKRMRESIHAVGSIWLSAWVDAGQPILDYTAENDLSPEESKELNKAYEKGKIKGREH